MTLFNVISILIFIIVLGASIGLRLYLKRQVKEADGVGEVHEKREEKGDNVATIGESSAKLD